MEAERGIYCTRWNSIRIINRAPGKEEEEEEEENPTTFSKHSVTKPLRRVRYVNVLVFVRRLMLPFRAEPGMKLLRPAVFRLCGMLPPFPRYTLMSCKNPLGAKQAQHLFLAVTGGKG